MPAPMTAAQLAEALGVSVGTVAGWARRGEVPFSRIGRRAYFDLAEILAVTKQPARSRPRLVARQDDEFSGLREWIARGGKTANKRKA